MQQRKWDRGEHHGRWEEPDILWMRLGPVATLEDMKWALDIYKGLAKERPYFLCCNVTGSNLEPEARKLAVKEADPRWFKGVCWVGAGALQKIITKSMQVSFLFSDRRGLEDGFAASEEEARTWIEHRRALYDARDKAAV